MSRRRIGKCAWVLGLMCVVAVSQVTADEPASIIYFRRTLTEKLHTAEQQQAVVIEGVDATANPRWLFFTAELKSLLSPPFWGEKATTVSRSSNPKFADPLPAILDFYQQLKAAGIELWLVPVPAKITTYPQQFAASTNEVKWRTDESHLAFYELLRAKGIPVVDLTADFRLPSPATTAAPTFCLTDSHWSGIGVRVAAKTLGEKIKRAGWYQPLAKVQLQTEPQTVEITGDLAILLNDKKPVKEKVALTRVFQMVDGKPTPIADDPASPILLLGDSHTLVFHDPALYAEGCGLADHLAEQTGIAVDVIGVRGSGANAARLNWRRRENPLARKKLVIWCFSMREFTENTDGWRVIPVTKR